MAFFLGNCFYFTLELYSYNCTFLISHWRILQNAFEEPGYDNVADDEEEETYDFSFLFLQNLFPT